MFPPPNPATDSNPPNYEDISDDAAATEFENTFGNLVSQGAGTPEEVAGAVDELLDTLKHCVTKLSTLEEMVAYVFDSAAGGQPIHYAACNFLANLAEKFTVEVQGKTLVWVIIQKLRVVSEKCTSTLEELVSGNADPASVLEARNLSMFFAGLSPKLMVLRAFKQAVPAIIHSISELMEKFVTKGVNVPKDDFLENCFCAVQMLKLTGPTIDELIRGDPSISQKIPGTIPKLYQTIRNILTDSNDLTPRIRAGIIKVLEFRASRWGEVPSPDQALEQLQSSSASGMGEVDPVWYGPDNNRLSKEEEEFMNSAAAELAIQSDEDEEEDFDQGEQYTADGYHNETAYYPENTQEGAGAEENQFIFRYGEDSAPDAAMEEFRRRLKPDYKPDAAGDRLRNN